MNPKIIALCKSRDVTKADRKVMDRAAKVVRKEYPTLCAASMLTIHGIQSTGEVITYEQWYAYHTYGEVPNMGPQEPPR